MSLTDAQKIQVASDNGIENAGTLMQLCRKLDFPFYIACAYLEQETSGGDNVFGSDGGKGSWFNGGDLVQETGTKQVTRDRYLIYRLYKDEPGHINQGVGPMQLTADVVQQAADAKGGCWIWQDNVETGLETLLDFKATRTWDGTALRWNGGQAFVDHNRQLRVKWKGLTQS